MISFFVKSNQKKPEREIELTGRSIIPILPLVALSTDTISLDVLSDIYTNLERISTFIPLSANTIQYDTSMHFNT